MHKIYLYVEKGGTGKTLSAYHLSWILGDLFNKRVLLVDLDAQKNLSFLYGVDGDKILMEGGSSIANCLSKNLNPNGQRKDIRECIIKDVAPNVDLAVSASNIIQANLSLSSEFNSHMALTKALQSVEDDYDYVFIDTHSTYDKIFENAICACDLIVPTLKSDFQNWHNFKQTMATLNSFKADGLGFDISGVFLTVYESTTKQSTRCFSRLIDEDYNICSVIKKSVGVVESAEQKMPIHKYLSMCQATAGYILMAHEILKHFGEDKRLPQDSKLKKKYGKLAINYKR